MKYVVTTDRNMLFTGAPEVLRENVICFRRIKNLERHFAGSCFPSPNFKVTALPSHTA